MHKLGYLLPYNDPVTRSKSTRRPRHQVDRLVGADIKDPAVPTSPGGVPARLSTAASGGGGGIWRNDIVEN
jgi:hypothetical protein